MKRTTLFIALATLFSTSQMKAQVADGKNSCVYNGTTTYTYHTTNAGWGASGYYKIIDIDAEKLTDPTLPQFTGASGQFNAANTDFKTGNFKTPIYTTEDGINYSPTSVQWPINYYMAAFAPTMYNSAYTKKVINGASTSGTGAQATCSLNDNSVIPSKIWDKKGFIELSRLASATTNTPPSLHGYIEIDSLPAVERIQWSYSSTSWKRGVKADINYHDGKGWQQLRWVASDLSSSVIGIATFAEQGYQFDEVINKQDDPSSYVSFRIRIWDGDSINVSPLSSTGAVYTATMTPYAQKQTVRVHQIRVYSGAVPTTAPRPKPLSTGIKAINLDRMNIYKSGNSVLLSEEADVQLYTIDGRLVYSGFTNKVNISSVPKGTYIIKAINAKGQVQNTKIMI